MPQMQFGLSAFERARGDLPSLPVVNFFVEEAPTETRGMVLQSRPGLTELYQSGDGPIDALFLGDGALASSRFSVSNGKLYSGSDFLGSLDGSGPFSMGAYDNQLFIAGGGSLWTFNGSVSAISFPDSASVSKVLVAASRVVALRADTDTFYWSEPLGSAIDALSFATAENLPDRSVDALFIDDVLIIGGRQTIEFWPNTQDADLPFQPLEGRVFERGVRATGCMTKFGSTFAWVSDIDTICLSDPENVISNPGLQAKIEGSTKVRLWTFVLEGTEFLALTLDEDTWIYSGRSKLWSQFASYGEANFLPQCYAGGGFGSSTDGRVMGWGSAHQDLGGVLERRFRAGFPLNSGGVTVDNIVLRVNVGHTPFLTGDYAEPRIEMRLSRDAGQTWGAWKSASLGTQAQYRKKVQFVGCGMYGQPGFLAEFRLTAPVSLRVSDVLFNEPFGAL